MALSRIKSKDELYRLRKGCSVFNLKNIEPAIGMRYKIFSPWSKSYYETQVFEWTAWDVLEEFVRDGNVFV
jgi:hypothetical protein